MVTYFEVDPASLDKFAAQLKRLEGHASAVLGFIARYEKMGGGEQFGGEGLLNYFWLGHEDHVRRAQTRTRKAEFVALLSSYGFADAADYYRSTDLAAARRLDQTYPCIKDADFDWVGNVPTESMRFEDRFDPTVHLYAPDSGDLQPHVAAIASGIGQISDGVSMSWWARQILLEVVGRDPFKDVVEFFAGDWEAVGRCTEGWMRCSSAVSAMASTMFHADEALDAVWKGNAADAAIDFVQCLHAATTLEAQFFYYLYNVYKAQVEITYFSYEIVNWLVGELLDLLAEAVVSYLTSMTLVGPVFVGLVAIADAIVFVLDSLRQVYHAFRAVAAAIGKPGSDDEPDFAMERLYRLNDHNVPASYQHPARR